MTPISSSRSTQRRESSMPWPTLAMHVTPAATARGISSSSQRAIGKSVHFSQFMSVSRPATTMCRSGFSAALRLMVLHTTAPAPASWQRIIASAPKLAGLDPTMMGDCSSWPRNVVFIYATMPFQNASAHARSSANARSSSMVVRMSSSRIARPAT